LIRVLLVEQHMLWREALSIVLSMKEDIKVVSDFARVNEAIDAAMPTANVGIISLDPKSEHNNLTAVRKLNDTVPGCHMLVLTDQTTAGSIHEALGDYVQGFASRDVDPNLLADYVRKVASGEQVVEQALAVAALRAKANPLSPREREVLRAIMFGMPRKKIAAELCLAEGTVRNLVSTIKHKIGAHNLMEAIRIAEDSGWL
jgi:two-component system, NarL family, response regulator DesR